MFIPFVLPYRAKNPPEKFPWVTVALIAINVLVFACTVNGHLEVRDSVVDRFAVSHDNLSLGTVFTAMFLHENLLHIGGNMLFLWIFGAATEGRLGPLRFLAVYLFAGIVGTLLSDFVTGLIDPDTSNLGASGAIMGLAGAYLYLFPYAPIRLLWFWWITLLPRGGVTEWRAMWVILYFFSLDVFNGIISGGGDGVGHFAHIGGAAAGFSAVMLLRVPRDSEDVSDVQATLSDMRDMSLLPLSDLEALMQRPTTDVKLILAYCRQSLIAPIGASEAKCLWGLYQYGNLLMEQAPPTQMLGLILPLSLPSARQIPPVYLLRLGTRLERMGSPDGAVRLYTRLCEMVPSGPDAAAAYLRIGRLMEQSYQDLPQARFCYEQVVRLSPPGALRPEAEAALRRLPAPVDKPQSRPV